MWHHVASCIITLVVIISSSIITVISAISVISVNPGWIGIIENIVGIMEKQTNTLHVVEYIYIHKTHSMCTVYYIYTYILNFISITISIIANSSTINGSCYTKD